MALTPKQKAFAEEYLLDLNATQAAIRAGYSEKTANREGSRLLSNVDIQKLIEEAKEKRSERVKIDADWVLKRLTEEATADVMDIYNDDGSLKPVKDWPEIWRTGLVGGIDIVNVEGGGSITKIKISDRIKRVELIGKHVDVQAFNEKREIAGKLEITTPSQVAAEVAEAFKEVDG